ncbi:hypothetical protein D3C71_1542500 [compost metagenome]
MGLSDVRTADVNLLNLPRSSVLSIWFFRFNSSMIVNTQSMKSSSKLSHSALLPASLTSATPHTHLMATPTMDFPVPRNGDTNANATGIFSSGRW